MGLMIEKRRNIYLSLESVHAALHNSARLCHMDNKKEYTLEHLAISILLHINSSHALRLLHS